MGLLPKNLVGGSSATGSSVTQIESKYVCMVNENVYEGEQILVEVDGLNYYGCCMGCKAKLLNDESYRFATDPVSGNQVNKALAIIGECNKKAYYFETLENLEQYEC